MLIEALSARVGGGVTRLIGTLDSLARVGRQHRYTIVLSRRYQTALLAEIPPVVNVHLVDFGPGLLRRAWFLNVELPRLVRRMGAHVIYAAAEGAYFHSAVPLVMMAGNMLLIGREGSRGYTFLRRPMTTRAFSVANRVAFVSASLRRSAVDAGMIADAKTFVAYHGVDRRFSPASRPREDYFLAVSSIMPHKGYDTLLSAFAQLSPSTAPLKVVGGDGDSATASRIRETIAARCLSGRVQLTGAIQFDRLPEMYRHARALIFPSEVESFGLPLVEAMASGTPVIASDLDVCREICGNAALYFPVGDVSALADLIAHVATDADARRKLRAAGLRAAARFDWDESTYKLVTAFEEAAGSDSVDVASAS